MLHTWLDTWRGIGDVVAGMARQDFDLELRRFDGRGWRATFFPSGFEHSFTSTAGSAWAATPWHAVQHAAAATLDRLEAREPARDWDDDRRLAAVNGGVTSHLIPRRSSSAEVGRHHR